MKITKVEVQKFNPNRFNIYINNKFAFGLTDELVYKYKIKKGNVINEDLYLELLAEEKKKKALNYTISLLSYRSRSEKELIDKLKSKNYNEVEINYAIDICKRYNYINDYNFANSFVRDKVNINKYGSVRIKYELKNKGIHDNVIKQALKNNLDYNIEYKNAFYLAQKRISKYNKDSKEKKYQKLYNYLNYRGYQYNIIKEVLAQVIN